MPTKRIIYTHKTLENKLTKATKVMQTICSVQAKIMTIKNLEIAILKSFSNSFGAISMLQNYENYAFTP